MNRSTAPIDPAEDKADGRLRDIVSIGDCLLRFPALASLEDIYGYLSSDLGHAISRPTSLSALGHHIGLIVKVGTGEQMTRTDAGAIVAFVKDMLSFGDRVSSKEP